MSFFPSNRSGPPTVQSGTIPAPLKGINSVQGLVGMEPTDAILTVNINASPYGLVVRPGHVEYIKNFTGDEVKTVMPFTGSDASGLNDRLFCSTNDGIFDITNPAINPVKVFNYLNKSSVAGWGVFTQVVNDGGEHALLLTDSGNGALQYFESTGLWGPPTISGPVGILVFVTRWKERVWYIEDNSTNAWYTDPGSFSGTLTKFNFGNKFRAGGNLVALYSWTLDAGDGPDDYLVAVSSGGDVVVYSGTDPSSSSTFGQVGRWFIGALPAGRRVGSQYGGDLLLLSSYGLISASDLLKGDNPFTSEGSLSWKIQGFLSALMDSTRTQLGWEVKLHPSRGIIIISTPKVTGATNIQFVYDVNVTAWGIWEGVPIVTSESFKGNVYFSSPDNSVWTLSGFLDNVRIQAQTQIGTYLFGYTYTSAPLFAVGDRITGQTSGASGTIYSISPTLLGVAGISGTFQVGEPLVGSNGTPLIIAVATSGANRVMRSGDAITWVSQSAAAVRAWQAVCWSPELKIFCAVGDGAAAGCVMTSPDGITWTSRTASSSIANGWLAVAWSPTLRLFCAVGNSTPYVMTSPDGITWTTRTPAGNNSWCSVIWDPVHNLFIAGRQDNSTSNIMTSPDGINWTFRTSVSAVGSTWMAQKGSRIITVNGNGGNSIYSDDGITWTVVTVMGPSCFTITASPSVYVALFSGTAVPSKRSAVGLVWTDVTIFNANYRASIYSTGLGLFVAVALSVVAAAKRVMTSPDGITWTERNEAEANPWAALAEGADYPRATLTSITLNPVDNLPREIQWRGLSAYSDLGAPEKMKRVSFIRPVFISDVPPEYSVVAKYEYDLTELQDFLNLQNIGTALWDSGRWDVARWDGSPQSRLLTPRGGSGMGRMVAVSWSGKSHADTTLASFGIMYDVGGMM